MKLPRNLDDLVDSGRHNLDGLVDGGRKSARRLYSDGRHWIADHLPEQPKPRDVRRSAGRAVARTRQAADERLRAPVRWIEERLMPEPRRTSSVLLPSVLAAAGAGVAFWWWTSWSRGRAEAADRAALDAQGGAAGKARPEQVLAHAPEPAEAPLEPVDTSAEKLAEPAEDLMAHSPPSAATAGEARLLASTAAAGLAGGVDGVAPAQAVKSLDETLAVQGAAPKGRRKPGEASA